LSATGGDARAHEEPGVSESAVLYFQHHATGKTELLTFNYETPYVFGTFSTRNRPLFGEG
jgi:hypothetical protein